MNTANHISQDDLVLFALQLLSEEEAEAALAHIRGCNLCLKQIAEFQGDLALYSLLAETHAPPASARERLLDRIADEQQVTAADTFGGIADPLARPPHHGLTVEPRRRPALLAWSGWALAAAFALAAGLQLRQDRSLKDQLAAMQGQLITSQDQLAMLQKNAATSQVAISTLTDPAALNVALRQPTAPGVGASHLPEGRAAYLPDRGALVFVATNLEPLKPYKVYELWLLPAKEGMPPIPAASFRPDAAGNATVILPTAPKLVPVKGFGVTQEDDRSTPKQPTLPILLAGTSKT